jgi:P-type Cu2+ transporter
LRFEIGGIAGLVNVVLNRGEIYFDSLTVLVFLLLVGRFIQYRLQRRADNAVGLLFSLTPASCRLVLGDEAVDAPVEALKVNDLVEVRAGDLLPADGVVENGRSSVNQALLTGESMPAAVEVGSTVHAGSQNIASVLRVRVQKVGRDTRVGQLMHLIERGVQDKPPIVQFADKVGGWFVAVVSIIAFGVFAFWSRHSLSAGIDHAVALLIVTCPCVLGLATPMTIAIAVGRLARNDILVKSGAVIEKLSRGGSLLLDKTGTLTEGRLKLLEWVGDCEIRGEVEEIEKNSNHPVGRALAEGLRRVRTADLSGERQQAVRRAEPTGNEASRPAFLPPSVLRGRAGEGVWTTESLGQTPSLTARGETGHSLHPRVDPLARADLDRRPRSAAQ